MANKMAIFALFLPIQPSDRYLMVQMDFLAADHVHIVGLCGQNWNMEVVLATIIDPEKCMQPQNAYKWAGIALLTSSTDSEIIFC